MSARNKLVFALVSAAIEYASRPKRVVWAMTDPVLSQAGFRAKNDTGGETSTDWIAAENTNWTQDVDTNFRVRFVVDETAGGDPASANYQLQYNLGGAGWNDVNGTSSVVRSSASPNVADDAATTRQLTSGSGTFVAGSFDEVNGRSAAIDIGAGGITEVEFCVQIRSADVADGNTIQLRVVVAVSTVLGNYAQTPTITVNEGLAAITGTGDADLMPVAAAGAGDVIVAGTGDADLRPIAASGAGVTAIPMSGLQAWYKADELALANNDPVASWTDESGNGNHATQATELVKPIYKTAQVNGLPAIDFTDHVLDADALAAALNGAGGASLFAVWKSRDFVSPVAAEVFYMSTGTAATSSRLTLEQREEDAQNNEHNIVNRRADGDAATHVSGAPLVSGDPFKVSSAVVDLPGNTATLWKNGVQDATGSPSVGSTYSATNALRTRIGAFDDTPTRTLDGLIAEIVFYNRALTTAERQQVEDYLVEKYAIGPSGSGDADLRPIAASGAGTVGSAPVTGTGDADLSAIQASGAGDVLVAGTGDADLLAIQASGSGDVIVAGTGDADLRPIEASSSGDVIVSGTGDADIGPIALAGSGDVLVSGTGDADLPALGASGAGDVDVVGTGDADLMPIEASGSGAVGDVATGSGVADIGPIAATGAGDVIIAGIGDADLMPLTALGEGDVVIAGTGDADLMPIATSGTGAPLQPIDATGDLDLPELVLVGAGTAEGRVLEGFEVGYGPMGQGVNRRRKQFATGKGRAIS